ncbi:MAG: DUF1837 domain-containing protein [Petrotogales bacterium]
MTDNNNYCNITDQAITVPSNHLDSWICKIHSHLSDAFNADFYLIRCTKQDVRTKEFLNGIIKLIINYSLNKDEIPDPIKPTDITDLWLKARERFVVSDDSGEPGEIILFALLETEKNAPQLLNKMALKTDGQLHYQGLDGIHIRANGDEIQMYYGESKLHKKRSSGITTAIAQLEEFHNSPTDEKFELTLVSNHIDPSKFVDSMEVIKKYISPYTRDKTNLSKTYAVFIGYDWDKLSQINTASIQHDLEGTLKKLFSKEISDTITYCSEKCNPSVLKNRIDFFFIPFPNVEEFRKQFKEVIS